MQSREPHDSCDASNVVCEALCNQRACLIIDPDRGQPLIALLNQSGLRQGNDRCDELL